MFPTQPWGERAGFTTTGTYIPAKLNPTGYRPESHDGDTSRVRKSRPTFTAKSIYIGVKDSEHAITDDYIIQDVNYTLQRGWF